MQSLGLVVLAAAAGFPAADVTSGLVHWTCDRYFRPDTPVIGSRFIAPFREHHQEPDAMRAHGWLERSGNNCLAALPLLVLALSVHSGHAVGAAFLAMLGLTLCLTNEIHSWAHAPHVPRVVRWLQQWGVLLSREHHARHHVGGGRGNYAIVSGWTNAWLDVVLPRVEVMLARLGLPSSGDVP